MKFPNGTIFLYDESFYRVIENKIHPIISDRAVYSWAQPVLVSEFIFDYEESSAKIGFRPTSILLFDSSYYYIDGIKKRHIATPEFWELGFNKFEAIEVSKDELDFHKDGPDLT